MELFNLLKPEAVKVISAVSSKKRLLHTVGELAQSVHGLDVSKTVEALQERETLGPTGVGSGVALPHARFAEIDRVVGTFIMLEKPVDFEAVDQQLWQQKFTPLLTAVMTKWKNNFAGISGV